MTRPTKLTRSIPSVPRPNPPSQQSKEPAHLPLHRRLLFPTLPASQALPALVPGGSADIALLNEKIYILIALAFRAYILTWLPRITRDRTLLPVIHHTILVPILIPIFTSLTLDPDRLIPFVLYDLPAILTRHWQVYWSARDAQHSALAYDGGLDEIYHAHSPLLSTEKTVTASDANGPEEGKTPIPAGQYIVSPLWLGALVDNLMKRNLPPAEYAVDVERTMIRDLLSRTILGTIARKVGEPGFFYAMLLRVIPARRYGNKEGDSDDHTILDKVQAMFSRFTALCISLWTLGTWLVTAYRRAPSTRYYQSTRCWLEFTRQVLSVEGRAGLRNWPLKIIWACIEIIFTLLSPFLDRLLPHLLSLYVLRPQTALRLCDLLTRLLFPLDGYPAPSPPDPTPEEVIAMRREIEERLAGLIPRPVRRVVVPSHTDVGWLLDPLSHAGCNAHLVAMVYSGVVGVIIPEMVVNAPAKV